MDEKERIQPDMEPGQIRTIVESMTPSIDGGRMATKRVSGEILEAGAVVLCDGHEVLRADLVICDSHGKERSRIPMEFHENDEWMGTWVCQEPGKYTYNVEAWIDRFATWHDGFKKRAQAGVVEEVDLLTGHRICLEILKQVNESPRGIVELVNLLVDDHRSMEERINGALSVALYDFAREHPVRKFTGRYPMDLPLVVDEKKALFSSWYEIFPRSTGVGGAHGTFRTLADHLPRIADLGFDVVYLPPIHPIGMTYRKGKNNTLEAGPEDPGSPWAIGSVDGGFFDIHPELGSFDDFQYMIARAAELDLEVALDIAFQCSPDHPWVKEHPEWFKKRPDGSIQYAENPPKKYQDIYPIDFETKDQQNLWNTLREVFRFWMGKGVRIFRVDNPHTKSLRFWKWVIDSLKEEDPTLIFLAEAFTRPHLMYHLAKAGFTQSYTYFTWRDSAPELQEYLQELTDSPVKDFFRPSFWPSTPDILPAHLVHGGRPAFEARLVLAGTLSPTYGLYGPAYEFLENKPLRAGSEEFLDSEKYQIRHRDFSRGGPLTGFIKKFNQIRKENPALHQFANITFHGIDNGALLAYSKRDLDSGNMLLIVVNFDFRWKQSGWVVFDPAYFGLPGDRSFVAQDILNDREYHWSGERQFIELNPNQAIAHIFRLSSEGNRQEGLS